MIITSGEIKRWIKEFIITIRIFSLTFVLAAYSPFSGELSWYLLIPGLTISFIIPAMMLSTERRDLKRDKGLSMGPLSTIIGSRASLILFDILVFGSFLLTTLYVILNIFPVQTLLILPALPLIIKAHRLVAKFERLNIPWTKRLPQSYLCILTLTL